MPDLLPTVLLVTPFADEREVFGDHFRHRGLRVRVCADPPAAIEAASTSRIDAAVVRLRQVGAIGGLDLLRHFRRQARAHRMGLVAITTYVQPEYRRAAEAAGIDSYIILPCNPDDLLSEVLRVCCAGAAEGRRCEGHRA